MSDYIFTIRQKVHVTAQNDQEAVQKLKQHPPFIRIWGTSGGIESLPGLQVLSTERRSLSSKEEKDLDKWLKED